LITECLHDQREKFYLLENIYNKKVNNERKGRSEEKTCEPHTALSNS
jgi:hypothetical protein